MSIDPIILFLLKSFGLLFLGFFLFKTIFPASILTPLSKVFVNILIPAMVLNKFLLKFNLDLLKRYWSIPLYSLGFIGFSLLAGAFIAKRLKHEHKHEFVAMLSFTNSGYIVLPMILELFKGESQEMAIIMNFLYTLLFMLLMWSLGIYLVTGTTTKLKLKKLPMPFVITLVAMGLGMLNLKDHIPQPVFTTLHIVGLVGVYGAMVILGGILSQLGKLNFTHIIKNLRFVFIKNILFPAVFILFIYLMRMDPLKAVVLSLVTITPPANNLAIITQRYASSVDSKQFVYSSIFASYMSALITIPVFMLILRLLYSI